MNKAAADAIRAKKRDFLSVLSEGEGYESQTPVRLLQRFQACLNPVTELARDFKYNDYFSPGSPGDALRVAAINTLHFFTEDLVRSNRTVKVGGARLVNTKIQNLPPEYKAIIQQHVNTLETEFSKLIERIPVHFNDDEVRREAERHDEQPLDMPLQQAKEYPTTLKRTTKELDDDAYSAQLFIDIQNGNIQSVREYFDAGNSYDVYCAWGNLKKLSPLSAAILFGQLDIVKYFIEEKNVKTKRDLDDIISPALIMGHLDVIKYLAELVVSNGKTQSRRYTYNILSKYNLEWPNICLDRGHYHVFAYLLNQLIQSNMYRHYYESLNHVLVHTAKSGNISAFDFILNLKIDSDHLFVNTHSLDKSLVSACEGGHFVIIRHLLNFLTDYIVSDTRFLREFTPYDALDRLIKGGHINIIDYILGFKLNSCFIYNPKPDEVLKLLKASILHDQDTVFKYLAQYKRDGAYFIGSNFNTLLLLAAEHSNKSIIEFLIGLKRDERNLCVPSVNNNAVVINACRSTCSSSRKLETIRYLCELRDDKGEYCLDPADQNQQAYNQTAESALDIIRYLTELQRDGSNVFDVTMLGNDFFKRASCPYSAGKWDKIKYLSTLKRHDKYVFDLSQDQNLLLREMLQAYSTTEACDKEYDKLTSRISWLCALMQMQNIDYLTGLSSSAKHILTTFKDNISKQKRKIESQNNPAESERQSSQGEHEEDNLDPLDAAVIAENEEAIYAHMGKKGFSVTGTGDNNILQLMVIHNANDGLFLRVLNMYFVHGFCLLHKNNDGKTARQLSEEKNNIKRAALLLQKEIEYNGTSYLSDRNARDSLSTTIGIFASEYYDKYEAKARAEHCL